MVTTTKVRVPVAIVGGGPVGIFLSRLLASYGVGNLIIEKRLNPTTHPQAHYLNARTMEILQMHEPDIFKSIILKSACASHWSDFVYCYSVLGREFHRIHHFDNKVTPSSYWQQTPANVMHFPQHNLESLFRAALAKMGDFNDMFFGYEAAHFSRTKEGFEVKLQSVEGREAVRGSEHVTIECGYLVGADGASSSVREFLGVPMVGPSVVQTLINVHFRCPGLNPLLLKKRAMLYFVFNERVVAVLVAHDLAQDEWVCQLPIFPPFQSPQDFDSTTLLDLLSRALGLPVSLVPKLQILSVRPWTMQAQVASVFSQPHSTQIPEHRAALVGDAAHRFPPAGGFGLNSGLQDAHNLAWKLALIHKGTASGNLLKTYHQERHPVAVDNCTLSMQNFRRTTAAARCLGVDPALAETAVAVGENSMLSIFTPLNLRKSVVTSALKLGLVPLRLLREAGSPADVLVSRLRHQLDAAGDLGGSGQGPGGLPLVFPKEEVDFTYASGALVGSACSTDSPNSTSSSGMLGGDHASKTGTSHRARMVDRYRPPVLRVGGRMPHCWVGVRGRGSRGEGEGDGRSWAVSTTYLHHIVSRLVSKQRSLRPNDRPSTVSDTTMPMKQQMPFEPTANRENVIPIVLLVPAQHVPIWIAAIDGWVIAMGSDSDSGLAAEVGPDSGPGPIVGPSRGPIVAVVEVHSPSAEAVAHCALQSALQLPRHSNQPRPTHCANQCSVCHSLRGERGWNEMSAQEVMIEFQSPYEESGADSAPVLRWLGASHSPCLSLQDLSGRVGMLMHGTPELSSCRETVVALRPDGHVAGIFHAKLVGFKDSDDLHSDRLSFLTALGRSLCLNSV